MEHRNSIQADVVKKIQECLKELGFEAEVKLSEHEGIVYARKEIKGEYVRVVTHITDREAKSTLGGPVSFEVARARLGMAVVRPTLAARTATRYLPPGKE